MSKIKPFKSDGCTLWPDGNYVGCCVEHDRAYHKGGSAWLKQQADLELRKCVEKKAGKFWGFVMYAGVSIFGLPFWPTKYRWGYGWDYKQSLTYQNQRKLYETLNE